MTEEQRKLTLFSIMDIFAKNDKLRVLERYELREIGEKILTDHEELNFLVTMKKLEKFR